MRKIILLIAVMIAITSSVSCQENISDGGFENCWLNKTSHKGPYLDFADNYFFNTLNLLYALTPSFGDGPLTSFMETNDVYEGAVALKIVSGELTTPAVPTKIFIPGAMGNIDIDIIGMDCSLGRPFTSRPVAIKGWYKYAPVNGDSAAIEIWLQKNGTVLGRGKQVITSVVSNWTQFDVPVNYTSAETPDTIVVIFSSSAKYDFTNIMTLMQCQGQIGSALYLDEIEFDYGTVKKDGKKLGWIYASDYVEENNTIEWYTTVLLPDTCLQSYTNSGNQNASDVHGIGMIFDPYSQSFGENHDSALFDKSYAYRLDTLTMTNFYFLGQNGYNPNSPDTLRIYLSYYEPYSGKPSNGDYRIISSYSPYEHLLPNIIRTEGNSDRIRPASANTLIFDYILTEKDTAVAANMPGYYYINMMRIPLDNSYEVPAGAVIGTMVKFIPGYDYNLGDTLYVQGDPELVVINNTFMMFCYKGNSNIFYDSNGYNGSNLEYTQLRYQMYGSFQDSCYFPDNNFLPNMGFHITYMPPPAKLEIDTIVCGDSYVYNDSTYHESGIYTHQFDTPEGDSIVVINLTILDFIGKIGNIQGNSLITQTGIYSYSIAPVPNATFYQWTVSNPKWTIIGTGTQISLNITEAGSTGVLSVKAIHANGICETETVTLSIEFCNAPLGTMGEIQGENSIVQAGTYTYSIAPVENAVSYQWTVSNPQWTISGSSTTTSVDVQINSPSTGILSVTAMDACGNNIQKDITIQSNVSVPEYEKSNDIQIYPNPVEDIVFVLIENNSLIEGEIQLFDIFGRLLDVQKITDSKTAIKMNSFSAGVYTLQIKENNKIIKSSKIVKTE